MTDLRRPIAPRGFTLIEVVVVLVCLTISVMIITPTLSSSASTQLSKAAETLASDLEFAQMDSMAHADDPRVVVIDLATNSYHIAARSNPALPLTHPDHDPYLNRFGAGRVSFLAGVTISKFDFGGDAVLGFGEQGDLDQITPATIEIRDEGLTVLITIDPLSGRATISKIH